MSKSTLQPLALPLLLAACLGAGRLLPATQSAPAGPHDCARALSATFGAVAGSAGRSVVRVQALASRGGGMRSVATGSGAIIRANGVILTNNHVVASAEAVRVTLQDGREFTARVLGRDVATDLAVVKIELEEAPFLALEESEPQIGEWLLALGNPLGLGHTVTAGILSGKGREDLDLAIYEDFLQTDAAINPGNSGGPLLNLDGRIVGINTAKGTSYDGTIGIGFAIPVHIIESVLAPLVEDGRVVRGFLGVEINELSRVRREELGLGREGVVVTKVTQSSPAQSAGLRRGDIVIAVEKEPVARRQELMAAIASYRPGSNVDVAILRDGRRMNVSVELAER